MNDNLWSFLGGTGLAGFLVIVGKIVDWKQKNSEGSRSDNNTRISEYREDIAVLKRELIVKDTKIEQLTTERNKLFEANVIDKEKILDLQEKLDRTGEEKKVLEEKIMELTTQK